MDTAIHNLRNSNIYPMERSKFFQAYIAISHPLTIGWYQKVLCEQYSQRFLGKSAHITYRLSDLGIGKAPLLCPMLSVDSVPSTWLPSMKWKLITANTVSSTGYTYLTNMQYLSIEKWTNLLLLPEVSAVREFQVNGSWECRYTTMGLAVSYTRTGYLLLYCHINYSPPMQILTSVIKQYH